MEPDTLTPLAEALEALEWMARQHCHTTRVTRDYNGQVAGTLVTDSGALSANEDALVLLDRHGRFRIIGQSGRMVVGYWPENLPPAATQANTDEPGKSA